jgi:hypothetical protein
MREQAGGPDHRHFLNLGATRQLWPDQKMELLEDWLKTGG